MAARSEDVDQGVGPRPAWCCSDLAGHDYRARHPTARFSRAVASVPAYIRRRADLFKTMAVATKATGLAASPPWSDGSSSSGNKDQNGEAESYAI